jgi:hypothetical protein
MARTNIGPGWWAYVPPGRRVRRRPVQVVRDGHAFNGMWELEGARIVVISAHGSRSAEAVAAPKRNAQAKRLLEEIVGDASAPRLS